MGFGRKWCNLLWLLLSTSSTRIIVNGELGDLISHLRGLRQEDPLSPMPFVLVMEVLSSLVVQATNDNMLHLLAIQHAKLRISFYADDVVLFIHPFRNDLHVVKLLLESFGHASGLKTNLTKS